MVEKKILITGASRGLGLAISKILSKEYTLILHATRKESFTHIEPGSHLLCADLNDRQELNEFCNRLKKEHGDTLVAVINNAGITLDKSLIYQPENDIDRILQVNLKAPVMICKAAMKIFTLKKRGVIINVSSVVGETGNAFQAVYAATKAGLIAFSKSLAKEVAALNQEHAIRILSISPGFIETDMTDRIPEAEKQKFLTAIPANRFGSVNEVAEVVAFLVSDKASYINGTNIHINGGLL
ncbi:SDR family oxidoreductase [Mucilaginibacter sp. OK283]|jgi:3-oxoacyl-[acyl-carrier protein] reductase|uniref:SDR family oxidoreductase n=1 Tax=Mucilaginibacter sp. OK283 TaxID=1881049 RepID=UPI0008C93469|nr:SDR family oxidoreductase [Mucilaginibacter sp. OK283]SEP44901.1 3-oxoacyl-[acyl-carrier protein] reductase [Mucilaginibacter sp. OK283]